MADEKMAEAAVLGGAFLGGGGGGSVKEGLKMAKKALEIGEVKIIDLEDLPTDATVLTTSVVGASSTREAVIEPSHLISAVQLLVEKEKINVFGLISSENGGFSTINGWIQSASLKIPVVDAPADGRAHPTGIMGSMGLYRLKNYISIQSAVGGDRKRGRYVELIVKGNLNSASKLVRQAAVHVGGLIAVARNPVSVDYVARNGAPKAIKQAIKIGEIILKKRGESLEESAYDIVNFIGGSFIDKGIVEAVKLEMKEGFDVGRAQIRSEKGQKYKLTFLNEFMTLSTGDKRLASFPDLITLINLSSKLPVLSCDMKVGQRVAILTVPKEKLILGQGVKEPELLKQLELIIKEKLLEE